MLPTVSLGIDRDQIVSAARAVFGAGLDADGYLRCFIGIECSLPQPNMQKFFYYKAAEHRLFANRDGAELIVPLSRLCERAGFPLRKSDQFLKRVNVATAAVAGSGIAELEECALLVFLRESSPELYRQFVRRQISAWEIFRHLRNLDPSFCDPSQLSRHSVIPFVPLLACVGSGDKPTPFYELLLKEYADPDSGKNPFEGMKSYISRYPQSHLDRLASVVDFSLAFKFSTA